MAAALCFSPVVSTRFKVLCPAIDGGLFLLLLEPLRFVDGSTSLVSVLPARILTNYDGYCEVIELAAG